MKCVCCLCHQEILLGEFALSIRPEVVMPGSKSGRPLPTQDFFPDGSEAKYVHPDCLDVRILELLYEVGHDAGLHRMQAGVAGW
jgi:hypothetical protein